MIRTIKLSLQRQQFNPGLLGIVTNPFYFSRRGLFLAMKEFSVYMKGKLLDVGCGTKPYEPYFSVDHYVGLEIDSERSRKTSKADLFYDGSHFPSNEQEYDAVLANEVFEHIFNPTQFLSEVHRVLKPGGMLLMTVPFVWDEHEQPFDYARYTTFGLRHIIAAHGFEVVAIRKTVSNFRVLFQLLNEYIYKITYVQNPALRQLLNIVLIAPFTIAGIMLSALLPANDDLYLDNVILARKTTHA